MPLYDLVVLVKAAVPRPQLADIMRRAGLQILDKGGVMTDIKSFGTRTLAYEFRKPGEKHYEVRYTRCVSMCTNAAALDPHKISQNIGGASSY